MGIDGANGSIVNNTVSRNSKCPKMVLIPGNITYQHYQNNSQGAQGPHIKLNNFYLAATETTRGQYACFLAAIDLDNYGAAVDWAAMVASPAPVASLSGVTVAWATALPSDALVANATTGLLKVTTTITDLYYMQISGTAGSRSEVYFPSTLTTPAYNANTDGSDAVNNPADPLRRDNFSMTNVSWYGALAFSVWFGGALPSEAQWEYAARMISPRVFGNLKYAGSNTLNDVAWSTANAGGKDHEVGTLKPTGMGLYDMNGNADEWCLDWCNTTGIGDNLVYNSTVANWNKGGFSGDGTTLNNPFIDPVYNTGSTRTFRGGSWSDVATTFPLGYRSGNFVPSNLGSSLSFRVAVAATLP
jgi:formylglycine-generating enzyme required for sulfatase activity